MSRGSEEVRGGGRDRRSVPSFIEARPPLVAHPWLRHDRAKQLGTNLLPMFEEDSAREPDPDPDLDPDLVQVYLRIKPSVEPNTLYDIRSDKLLATSTDVQPSDYNRKTQCNVSKLYTFSHIFREDSSQKELFERVVKENLIKLPEGHSYTLLTYGASGSGKTYTLMGTVIEPGLVPRSLEYVFKIINPAQHPQYRPRDGTYDTLTSAQQAYELQLVSRLRKLTTPGRGARRAYKRMSVRLSSDFQSTNSLVAKNSHYVWVSFVEIYNEAVYDLLQPMDRNKPAAKLRICQDNDGIAYVKGATQAFVRTGAEAYDIMVAGKVNLRVASTGVHARSSRSHCIFTITLLSATVDGVLSSCVRFCDLAGSERAERTHNEGVRMAESRAINSSLHVLERCLLMLRRKQRGNTTLGGNIVPFRESKLTRLLGAPLTGASHEAVSMVVTINTSPLYVQETRHVLQLSAVASEICVNTTMEVTNYNGTDSSVAETSLNSSAAAAEIMMLRADNERLRFEMEVLSMRLEEAERLAASNREVNAASQQEIADEATHMTTVYFEKKIQIIEERHRAEKKVLKEQLDKLVILNTQLKEQLAAGPLKCAVVESELEHLHACLAERDQADTESPIIEHNAPPEPVLIVDSDSDTDSESDSDYDNMSLDDIPREMLNRSRKMDRSKCDKSLMDTSVITHYIDSNIDESDDLEKNKGEKSKVSIATNNHNSKLDVSKETNSYRKSYDDEEFDQNEEYCSKENNASVENLEVEKVEFDNVCDKSIKIINELGKMNDEQVNYKKGVSDNAFLSVNVKNYDNTFKLNDELDKSNNEKEIEVLAEQKKLEVNEDAHAMGDHLHEQEIVIEHENSNVSHKSFRKSFFDIEINTSDNDRKIPNKNNSRFSTADTSDLGDSLNLEKSIDKNVFNMAVDVPLKYNESETEKLVNQDEKLSLEMPVRKSIEISVEKCENAKDMNISNHIVESTYGVNSQDINAINENSDTPSFSSNTFTMKECILNGANNDYVCRKFTSLSIDENICANKSKNYSRNMTLDEISLPNLTDIDLRNEKPQNKNLFTNEIEIVLDERQEFMSKDVVYGRKENDTLTLTKDMPILKDSGNLKAKDLPTTSMNITLETIVENPLSNENTDIKNIANNDGIISVCCPNTEALDIHSVLMLLKDKKFFDLESKPEHNMLNVEQNSNDNIKNVLVCKEEVKDDVAYQSTENKTMDSTNETPFETASENVTANSECYDSKFDGSAHNNITETDHHESENESTAKKIKKYTSRVTKHHNSDTSSDFEEKPRLRCRIKTTIENAVEYNLRNRNKINDSDNTRVRRLRRNLRRQNFLSSEVEITETEDSKNVYKKTDDEEEYVEVIPDSKLKSKKLKDIANLQKEFSDITAGIPCVKKEVRDIASPEKKGEENVPPNMVESQSCPAKSARSRRKLWTPQTEPLDESMASDDDSNGRVRIPRPSYHRATRVRRKL